jgi:hypothetical protein
VLSPGVTSFLLLRSRLGPPTILKLVIAAILSGFDTLPPSAVFLVPAKEVRQVLLESVARHPPQGIPDFARIYGITPVVARAVWNISYEAFRAPEGAQDGPNYIQVRELATGADVVDLAGPAVQEDQFYGPAVVFHMDPVADVKAVPVNGERLIL